MSYVSFATDRLKKHGYKMTEPRRHVLGVLSRSSKPLSAYQIKSKLPSLKPFSIYRILDLLIQLKLAHKLHSINSYVKCEHKDPDRCHHLILCKKCMNTSEVVVNGCMKSLDIDYPKGFQPEGHYVEIMGLCQKCSS